VCAYCGIDDPTVFEFHHTDPTKKNNRVSVLVSNASIKKLEEELRLCICLCANCHRKLHHDLKQAAKKHKDKDIRGTKHAASVAWVNEHKKLSKCKICGEGRAELLDLHHRDSSEKEDCISNLVKYGSDLETVIKKEVEKCSVLCVNCHRKWHKENGWRGEKLPS